MLSLQIGFRIVIILLLTLLIGYFGAFFVTHNSDPVSLRVASISQDKIHYLNNTTTLTFLVVIEAWNIRYRPTVIYHGSSCGVLPDIESSVNGIHRLYI